MTATSPASQERLRTNAGLQCPECYGVRVEARMNRFQAQPEGWLCTECGCQWSPPLYPPRAA